MGSISSHVYHIHHQEPQSRRSNVKGSNRAHHRAHLRPVFSDHVEATSVPRLPKRVGYWRLDICGTAPTPMYGLKWCENKNEPHKKQLITFFGSCASHLKWSERLLFEKKQGLLRVSMWWFIILRNSNVDFQDALSPRSFSQFEVVGLYTRGPSYYRLLFYTQFWGNVQLFSPKNHTFLQHSPSQNPTRRFIARQRLSPCWLLATLMPVKPLLLPGDARWAQDPSYKHLGL